MLGTLLKFIILKQNEIKPLDLVNVETVGKVIKPNHSQHVNQVKHCDTS